MGAVGKVIASSEKSEIEAIEEPPLLSKVSSTGASHFANKLRLLVVPSAMLVIGLPVKLASVYQPAKRNPGFEGSNKGRSEFIVKDVGLFPSFTPPSRLYVTV